MAQAVVGQCYRHFKGGEYKVLYLALDSYTLEPVVVYCDCHTDKVWTRFQTEFEGWHESGVERFVKL